MKFLFTLVTGLLLVCQSFSQSITEIFLPQYIQGSGTLSAADDRKVPYVCRLQLNGLQPSKTYRYYNRLGNPNSSALSGEGNYILVKNTGDFVRVTSPSLATAGRYGELTTDASGSYTGWFVAEVSSSSLFTPGNNVVVKIILNNGNGGIGPTTGLVTRTIKVIGFNNTPGGGSSIRSTAMTGVTAKNFVFLWDNADGIGRPVAGSFVESDGSSNTIANGYAPFYSDHVNGIVNTWGTIIPNNMSNGVRRIAQYSLADGSQAGYKLSADGSWPSINGTRTSTLNTTGGLTSTIVLNGAVIRLDGTDLKSDQTITFDPLPAKIYGDPDFDAGATSSAEITTLSYSSSDPNVISIAGNQLHIAGAGTAQVTAAQPGDDFFNPAVSVIQPITVNKASLTIKADDQFKVQGNPNPVLTATYTGFVNGEDASVLNPSPVISTTATQSSATGTYPITVAGAGSFNYTITYQPGILTITATTQTQTIRFDPLPAKTYGDADFDPGATSSSGLEVSYTSSNPSVATIVNNQIHITGAGTTVITASQSGSTAYDPAADMMQVLTINRAPLTIKADDKTRLEGHPNPVLTITYTGFVYNETPAMLVNAAIIATIADAASLPGNYPITVSGAASNNYNITFVDGVLTVQPLPAQIITFNELPVKTYGDAAFPAGAVSSAGLTIAYTSSDPSVASITNGLISIHAAGSIVIKASQPGDPFNAPADPVSRVLTVKKAHLLITANNLSKKEGQPNPVLTIAYNGFVNGDDVSDLAQLPQINTTAAINSVAGAYPIAITGAMASNYNIAHIDGTLTILPGTDASSVIAYPSAPGKLRVNYHAAVKQKVSLQLFDSYGNKVLDTELTAFGGMNTWYFETGQLAAGVYPLRLNADGALIKTKVFIR